MLWLLALPPAHASADEIGPGDVLRIEVFGEPAMGGQVTISDDGKGTVYCGTVDLVGADLEEARSRIEACFRDGYLVAPRVGVEVVKRRSTRIEVGGAVAKPGEYFLEMDTPLRTALTLAGGVALDRSANVVVLLRADGARTEVALEELDGPSGDVLLRKGDIVTVEQGKTVFVGGEVSKEGPVGYKKGLTAYQALMNAGGPSPLANMSRAWILRDRGDGTTEKIRINLRRVQKGKDPDPELRPGDTVMVPESPL